VPAKSVPISPLVRLLPFPMAVSGVLGIAYWMTQAMSPNEPKPRRQWWNLGKTLGAALLGVLAVAALGRYVLDQARHAPADVQPPTRLLEAIGTTLGLVLLGMATVLVCALLLVRRRAGLTSELRRRLTGAMARCNLVFMVVAVFALIDSLGAGLDVWIRFGDGKSRGTIGVAVLPMLAFLIKKLPDWFGGSSKGGLAAIIGRFLTPIAFIAGVTLYGMLAIAADALVHRAAWVGAAWTTAPDWPGLWLAIGVTWVMALLAGMATGFINLSSLHLLYASRLTRAYLGATNNGRLESAASNKAGARITDNQSSDYIQPALYSRIDLPAPLHILNCTINETIDPQSALIARDRKGDILSVEPGGIKVGENLVAWDKLDDPACAEHISLGQWCAISGAAASSGMGRLTNLGFALALTFANVRLGYWWWSPGIRTSSKAGWVKWLYVKLFGTFVYLFNEMTARYSRAYARKYLTDGGHFENSGAYALIRRRVPLILVTDNGADPNYTFADLENLVRLVRLDLGGDLALLGGTELGTFLDGLGAMDRSIFVDPAMQQPWQAAFAPATAGDPTSGTKFVLVLRVVVAGETLHLIWLKPRSMRDMPHDIAGYAAANPSFPQQSTGDQFFDEAQWESYRALGELSMARLLACCPALLA
jgi:hypothetical protein